MNCIVRGRTAVHARGLARQARTELLRAGIGGGLTALGLILLYRNQSTLLAPALIAGIPALAFAAFTWSKASTRWGRAQAGVRAEDIVAQSLRHSGAYCLINGVVLGRGDIDHVILGPWVVAVETKHGRGDIGVDQRGRVRVGTKTLPRDPLGQAKQNARSLSRNLGRDATAMLVLSEGRGRPFIYDGVIVCGREDLIGVLRGLPQTLDEASARRLAVTLPVASL